MSRAAFLIKSLKMCGLGVSQSQNTTVGNAHAAATGPQRGAGEAPGKPGITVSPYRFNGYIVAERLARAPALYRWAGLCNAWAQDTLRRHISMFSAAMRRAPQSNRGLTPSERSTEPP
jgi:hypothetical protein